METNNKPHTPIQKKTLTHSHIHSFIHSFVHTDTNIIIIDIKMYSMYNEMIERTNINEKHNNHMNWA